MEAHSAPCETVDGPEAAVANTFAIPLAWNGLIGLLCLVALARLVDGAQDRTAFHAKETEELAVSPLFTVDPNTASLAELQALPTIGPALAARILAYRRLHGGIGSLEDLQNVHGFGPKRLEELRPLIFIPPEK